MLKYKRYDSYAQFDVFIVRVEAYCLNNTQVRNENLIFLLLNQNICCGYSKGPSQ